MQTSINIKKIVVATFSILYRNLKALINTFDKFLNFYKKIYTVDGQIKLGQK
jgi:hypothetical protein